MADDQQDAKSKVEAGSTSDDKQATTAAKTEQSSEGTHMQAVRERINELAAKAKTPAGLTQAETEERAALRQEFLANFKKAFQSQVEMMQVFDKDGQEVTPDKVRQIQHEKGLRDD